MVSTTLERDGQLDLPKGYGLDPVYDPMEWGARWPYCCSRQAHGVVCLSVKEVEAASAIHKHLGQALLANNRVDDKRAAAEGCDRGGRLG